jgi:hypothetical protein
MMKSRSRHAERAGPAAGAACDAENDLKKELSEVLSSMVVPPRKIPFREAALVLKSGYAMLGVKVMNGRTTFWLK